MSEHLWPHRAGEKTVPGLQAADILANRTYDAGRTYKGSGPLERSFWIERLDQIERGDEWKHFVIRFGGRETLEQIVETLRPWWLSVAGAGS